MPIPGVDFMLILNITFPNGEKQQYDLSQVPLPMSIGRDNGDAYVKIPDPYLSKVHALIFKRGPHYCIKDCGSRNGTIVNGLKIEESHIEAWDVLSIGTTEMQIVDNGEEPKDPFVGKNINGYVLDCKIGQGNQAAVYLSKQNPLHKPLALKIIEVDKHDPKKVAFFDNESYQISKLNHKHIIKAHDFFEVDGIHVIVMGLLEGDDALQEMRQHGAFTVRQSLRLLMQIGDAIGHLKEIGVVHRDIKPANIIITEDHDYVLTDFGLARDIRGSRSPNPGRVAGTPLYMSPEQIIGKSIDHRADIYSLGATVWHVLTGQPVFSGANTEILKAHLATTIPTLTDLMPNVNRAFAQLLQRMLAKDPAERYGSGLEIAQHAEALMSTLKDSENFQIDIPELRRQIAGSGTRKIVKTRSRS